MADRYWVGGTGVWTTTNTLNWSATSGGPAGASAPTSSDDVYFDANSDTGSEFEVVLERGTLNCRTLSVFPDVKLNMTSRAYTNSDSILQVYGSFLTTNNPFLFSFQNKNHRIYLMATTGTHSIDTGGNPIYCHRFDIAYGLSSPTVTFNFLSNFSLKVDYDKHTLESYMGGSGVSINTNGYTLTLSDFFNLSGGASFNATASTLVVNYVQSSGLGQTIANNVTWRFESAKQYNMTLSGNNQGFFKIEIVPKSPKTLYIMEFFAVTEIENLIVYGPDVPGLVYIYLNPSTIYQNIKIIDTAVNRRICFIGAAAGVTINSISPVSDVDFSSISPVGNAAPISGTRLRYLSTVAAGPTVIESTFSPKTVYWNKPEGGYIFDNAWATSPTGSPSLSNFPFNNDTIVFTDTGISEKSTVSFFKNSNEPNLYFPIKTIDASEITKTFNLSASTNRPIFSGSLLLSFNTSINVTFGGFQIPFRNNNYSPHYISGIIPNPSGAFALTVYNNANIILNTVSPLRLTGFQLSSPARFNANGCDIECPFATVTIGSEVTFGTGLWTGSSFNITGRVIDPENVKIYQVAQTGSSNTFKFIQSADSKVQLNFVRITLPSSSPNIPISFVGPPPKNIELYSSYNYSSYTVDFGTNELRTGGYASLPDTWKIESFKIINLLGSPTVNFRGAGVTPTKLVYTGQGSINFDKIVLNGTIVEPANTWFATNSTGNDPGWVYSAGPQITTSVSPITIGQQTISISGTSLNAGDGARIIQNSQKVDLNYTSGSSPTFDAPTLEQMFSNGVKFGTAKLAIMENK